MSEGLKVSNRLRPDDFVGLTWAALCRAYEEHARQARLLNLHGQAVRSTEHKARSTIFLHLAVAYLVGLISGVIAFWLLWSLTR